jgi:C4-dicarboxylate-specific signal transduction histidine kinase
VLTEERRAFNRFKESENAAQAQLPSAWTPTDVVKALGVARASAKSARETLRNTESKRKAALVKARDSLSSLAKQDDIPPQQKRATKAALSQLDAIVSDWDSKRADLEKQLDILKEDQAITSSILNKFDDFKNQVNEVYEAVALGLAAESLAHEVGALLDDLVARTNRAMAAARRSGEPSLVGYLEVVRAIVSSLRKQVSFLDPMLRATREQKSTFSIEKFLTEFVELRVEHMTRLGINLDLVVKRDFTVKMSRGRLQQVIENLCRNSEFWLQSKVASDSSARHITLTVDSPSVIVSDSGPGVKQGLENSIFEPFISGKPAGQGRGLGLFISRQLLRRDGCDIELAPDRNSRGRRGTFVVSLEAVEQP